MILTEPLCSLYVSSPGLKVAGLMPKIHYLEAARKISSSRVQRGRATTVWRWWEPCFFIVS
jgi:hypothetical protein